MGCRWLVIFLLLYLSRIRTTSLSSVSSLTASLSTLVGAPVVTVLVDVVLGVHRELSGVASVCQSVCVCVSQSVCVCVFVCVCMSVSVAQPFPVPNLSSRRTQRFKHGIWN